jgi:hypothetical protein
MKFLPSNVKGWIGVSMLGLGISLASYGGYRIGSRIELMQEEGINKINSIYEGMPVRRISEEEYQYRNSSLMIAGIGLGIAATGALIGSARSPTRMDRTRKQLESFYNGRRKRYRI